MARLYKCYGTCGNKYEKTELVVHSNKNYCKQCYEKMIREVESRQTLYNLIKTHYGVTFPTSMHLAQIKKVKELNYTYDDMILGLRYCVDVLHLKFRPNMGFGYVSNNIEAAKMHYKELEEKQQHNDNIFSDNILQHKTVKVAKIDNTNNLKKSKFINLEDILC